MEQAKILTGSVIHFVFDPRTDGDSIGGGVNIINPEAGISRTFLRGTYDQATREKFELKFSAKKRPNFPSFFTLFKRRKEEKKKSGREIRKKILILHSWCPVGEAGDKILVRYTLVLGCNFMA